MDGLSWYERAVLKTLRELYQFSRNYIHTRIVAGFLDKNDRIVRGVLVRLEQKQVVIRKGERGGWKPVDMRALAAATAMPPTFKTPHRFNTPTLVQGWKPQPPKSQPQPIMLESYLTKAALQAV